MWKSPARPATASAPFGFEKPGPRGTLKVLIATLLQTLFLSVTHISNLGFSLPPKGVEIRSQTHWLALHVL